MTALEFWVSGTPKAQPRVKAFARGKHARVYTPDTADAWKAEVRRAAIEAGVNFPRRVPLLAFLTFVMPRPKSRKVDYWHTSRPDADNLAKAVLDALGDAGIWGDDAQVARMVVQKIYVQGTEHPGCAVVIDRI